MTQKLILKRKSKKKSEKKLSSKQKVALHALQKQLQSLQLKQWLVIVGLVVGGAALRAPMQVFPSAEPITFFAILAGWLFGKKKGFITGASAAYLSNFLMFGGQGPWTIFQAFAWGLAGFLGGFIRNIKPQKNYFIYWAKAIIPVLLITTLATLSFDIILNLGWALINPFSIFALFLSGLPFLLIHLVSNISFSLFLPFARKFVHETGKFDEISICNSVISRIHNSNKHNRKTVSEQ